MRCFDLLLQILKQIVSTNSLQSKLKITINLILGAMNNIFHIMLIVGLISKHPTIRGDIYSTTSCKTNKTVKSTDFEMSDEPLTIVGRSPYGSTDQYSPGPLFTRPNSPSPDIYVKPRGKSKHWHLPPNTVCPRYNAVFAGPDIELSDLHHECSNVAIIGFAFCHYESTR